MVEKKIKGRKRHIITDVEGHLLHVKVHAANIHDTVAGGEVFEKAVEKYPSLLGACGDDGYRGTFVKFVEEELKKKVSISKKITAEWSVIAKRWVVERTFSWLNHYRRLSKDFETTVKSAESMVIIAHAMVLVRRL